MTTEAAGVGLAEVLERAARGEHLYAAPDVWSNVAEEVRTWLRAALTSPGVVAKAGKAIHARWAHEGDGECLDPSGCGATVDDEAEATAALAAAAETLGAK